MDLARDVHLNLRVAERRRRVGYIEQLLALGPFIGMDRYGLDIILPTAQRNRAVAELCRRGHAARMMLGQDACASIDWYPREMVAQMAPDWHFSFIFDSVLSQLEQAGVAAEQLDAMPGANVHAWLAS